MVKNRNVKKDMEEQTASEKNFGTFTPIERPSKEELRAPFGNSESVGRCFCQLCGQMFEIRKEHVDPMVRVNNALKDENFDSAQFDGGKHFFIAKGCMECAEEPIFLVQTI